LAQGTSRDLKRYSKSSMVKKMKASSNLDKAGRGTDSTAKIESSAKVIKHAVKQRAPYVRQPAKMSTEKWKSLQVGMDEKWPAPEYMNEPHKGGHNCYRDETYMTITRWTAETRIMYRPHAKAPGSKSHIRYEKYARARTVKEALKLGSWPADWCWDYERGFIKVVGGRLREEPIDPSIQDLKSLDEVDRILAGWFVREAARMLGMSLHELSNNSEARDNLILRMRRTVADKKAKEVLDECTSSSRKILESEVLAILKSWGFKKNVTRLNVAPEGAPFVFSDTVGLVSDRTGHIVATGYTLAYPNVASALTKFMHDYAPVGFEGFPFTSINVNKNYAGRRHRDGNNVGPSFIKALGSFKGGQLKYFPDDDRSLAVEELSPSDSVTLNLGKEWACFDGRRGHEVTPFQGERYSLVYFMCPRSERANAKTQTGLRKCGFSLPTASSKKKFLAVLGAPGSADDKPKFVSWPLGEKKGIKRSRK